MLLSKNSVLGARYACFGLLVALSSVICTVSVYNFSLAKTVGIIPGVDIYLILLSAWTLLFVIPIIFVDVIFKDAFISRVWVECTWIAFFWMAELVAAIAFTATVPSTLCHGSFFRGAAACQSSQALEACIWLCMLTLFGYLIMLLVSAAAHERVSPNVWQTGVRNFPWFSSDLRVGFPDPAPPYGGRPPADPVIVAPQPRQLLPRFRVSIPVSVRNPLGRLSARTPPMQERNMDVPLPPDPTPPPRAASRLSRMRFSRRSSARTVNRPTSRHPYDPEAFYPEHLQGALRAVVYDAAEQRRGSATAPPRRHSRPLPFPSSSRRSRPNPVPPVPTLSRPLPVVTIVAQRPPQERPRLTIDTTMRSSRPLPPPRPVSHVIPAALPPAPSPTSASVSPLGSWPRSNVLSLPLRPRKRPPPPPSAFPPVVATAAAVDDSPESRRASGSSDEAALSSANAGLLPARLSLRPTGPRSRHASISSMAST